MASTAHRPAANANQRPDKRLSGNQNLTRSPNCSDRGSPTAVIWPKVGDGFVGYAPAPKFVLRVSAFTPIGQVEHFGQRLRARTRRPAGTRG